MRLLACESNGKLSFTKNIIDDFQIPPYAILSHTWHEGEEVTFDELQNDSNTAKQKSGYEKILFCARQAQSANLRYFWVDTCCINKAADLSELQEALNSMFRWYQRAVECYVYLSDVSVTNEDSQYAWEPTFRRSRWFTRGWTLQELLAPHDIIFFSCEGKRLGNKRTLERQIHEITGIPVSALRGTPLSDFSVKERMSWIRGRMTTRKEDMSYSLLGVFNVFMLPNYGEGEDHAFKRLREEIEKLESPWLVPFPRPRFFVGRKAQLAQIDAHILAMGGQRLAIYGLGGCGKTALALESVYNTKEQQPARAIFWVSAVSRDSFEQGYLDIAALLRGMDDTGDDKDDEKRDIKQQVKTRLSDEKFGQWLLVVDNADNADVLFGQREAGSRTNQLINYLPVSSRGSILFTTRTRSAAINLAESNVIALGELDKSEATEILETRLLREHQHHLKERATIDDFLGMLSFLALAIVQAVAYVNMNDIGLSEYIALYRSSEQDAVKLLSQDFEDQGRYRDTTNSIATTWFISFEQIQKKDGVAADYLSFMACVANNDIPLSMLPARYTDTERTTAISTLEAYAFLAERQLQKDGQGQAQGPIKMFNVHPLVHLSMRSWLTAHEQWDTWKERAVARLLDLMPYGDSASRHVWTRYLPHAQHLVNIPETGRTKGRIWLLEVVGSCEKRVWFEYHNQACREAAKQGEELVGKEYLDLSSVGTRAKVMMFEGNDEGAKRLLREAIATEKKTRGEARTYTLLVCTAHLAWCLNNYGWYKNAEVLLREQLAGEESAPGSVPPWVLVATMAHMGIALRGQKKAEAGNEMLRGALALDEKIFGKSHSIIESLGKVGRTLNDLAKYTDMEKSLREELGLRTKTLGIEHTGTQQSMDNLRTTLHRQEEFKSAEEVQRQLLALKSKKFGKEHPKTLRQRGHLAHILACQTRYAEAEQLERETLALKDRILGEQHLDTLSSVLNLAHYLDDQEQHEDALEFYKRACIGYQTTLGPDHETTKKWTYIYDALKEVVDSGQLKSKSLMTPNASSASVISESEASNTAELVVRPKGWWRPDLKKWKTRKHRWFAEDGSKK